MPNSDIPLEKAAKSELCLVAVLLCWLHTTHELCLVERHVDERSGMRTCS